MPELTHKDAHVCNWDQESFAIDLPSGKTIEGIGTLKANWNYFVPATEQTLSNGLLIRKGDVTLVNPDGQAPIAALNIKMDEKIYFLGERQNVEWSRVRIEAYPRDPQSLDIEGQGA